MMLPAAAVGVAAASGSNITAAIAAGRRGMVRRGMTSLLCADGPWWAQGRADEERSWHLGGDRVDLWGQVTDTLADPHHPSISVCGPAGIGVGGGQFLPAERHGHRSNDR